MKKDNISDTEKILNLLTLMHEENKAIMTRLLQVTCYPKDFDKATRDVIRAWDGTFNECIGEKVYKGK